MKSSWCHGTTMYHWTSLCSTCERAQIASRLNGRSLRRLRGRHIQCYLDIFLLLGFGSFTWRSLDGIWGQTDDRGANVMRGKWFLRLPAVKTSDTHRARHLIQLAHGLVDSSFQVIIQFPWSVGQHWYNLTTRCQQQINHASDHLLSPSPCS